MTEASAGRTHRYRRWEGELRKGRWTWLAIVTGGIRLALQQPRNRVLILTSSFLVLGSCVTLYVISLLDSLVETQEAEGIYDFVRTMLGVDISGVSRIGEYREMLWRAMFLVLVKAQMFWILIVVARIGPPLIANDLRFRALPIYFSKPVRPWTYVAGKWLVLVSFIAMVSALPNLVSLLLGTLITGGLSTWARFADLFADLFLSGLLLCVVAGSIGLALSSVTSDRRYATVAWLAVCLLPVIAQAIVDDTIPEQAATGWLGCISLRDNLMVLCDWLLGVRESLEASGLPTKAFSEALVKQVPVYRAAVVSAGWTAAAVLVTYRRVIWFSRSAANV